MPFELLLPDEMAACDRRAIATGPFDGYQFMQRAGAAVAAIVLERFPAASRVDVLCGPGNNGGDGYVVAELLRRSGVDVAVYAEGPPRDGSDAALAAADCKVWPQPLAAFAPSAGGLVVDAVYGAGLARPVGGAARRAMESVRTAGVPVVAVDLPSGVSGATGEILGETFQAAVTVTFVRKKPGHLLQPGRTACGEVVVADIGIGEDIVAAAGATCFENGPELWKSRFPRPAVDSHKYSRGHVAVFSGAASATGAARLSALAAARAGAGAVTLLSPSEALAANAAHLTSIMLRKADTREEALAFFADRRPAAFVYGPGLDASAETGRLLFELIDRLPRPLPAVVDASALTSLAAEPGLLAGPFGGRAADLVITPHEGEFGRLFPDLRKIPSKLERARRAADRVEATVVYKGPDTVIAAPDGRAAINANGTPWLATAGSGDVLSGIVAGFLAQGMPGFEAACAGVWIHAEAARRFGPGLIAEDIPGELPAVLRDLLD
ncbi:NAD(P)H-hydrate dehydratase [Kumtagia ephedrae]|uniref:Bifunctional NAD(P)H-hydrate repair enzyme n=1 Tax=Kumtagia ephedrae TaxID=2116701 RepID=A0A2P7STR1_9HYPH|nr:NAD(P)H-hydrate dehydratase [Mesorhizobium ephedrae]PSJ65831.1 bifunctional ADP-dependent NAD(P)H-hydrate dehydratase/NAD(P)H-hydrate epimerase [Mesorhizobium ephedrae]